MAADRWKNAVALERLRAILLTLLLSGIVLGGLSLLEWRRWFPADRHGWWFRNAESLLIAALGTVLTGILVMTANDLEERRNIEDFNRLSDAQAQIIGETFRDVRRELSELGRFLQDERPILSRAFQAFADPVARSSCVLALGWVSIVAEEERGSFESWMRLKWDDSFTVFEKTASGQRIAAAGRDEYYPIAFVAPLQGNEAVVGFDLGSEPVRRETLERAVETHLSAATPPIPLVHEEGSERGVIAYEPVFRGGANRPIGFVFGAMRLQSSLERMLAAGGGTDPHITVVLVDVASTGELYPLASYPEGSDNRIRNGLPFQREYRSVHPLFMLDRTWAIVARPSSAFLESHFSWVALLTGLAGLLGTVVASVFVSFLGGRQAGLERKVMERTRKLRGERNRSRHHTPFHRGCRDRYGYRGADHAHEPRRRPPYGLAARRSDGYGRRGCLPHCQRSDTRRYALPRGAGPGHG